VVHRRSGKLGVARVKQELAAKGLSGEAVALALEGLRETELDRAWGVWRKKFGRPAEDANERAKQIRFLLTRGFNAEVVRKVVQGAEDDL
jgi:regulatory protein